MMAPGRKATGTIMIALAVIIAVIVGATGLVLIAQQVGDNSVSGAGEHPSTFYSTVSPQGLQLQVELNTTAIRTGGALTAQVLLFNTLARNLSLVPDYSAMKELAKWDWDLSLCGSSPVYDAFSFALFQGHYTSANISLATGPLRLAPPTLSTCAFAGFQAYVQKIEFAGGSHLATITANPSGESNPLGMQAWSVKMQANATTGYCKTSSSIVTVTTTENGSETTSTVGEPGSECGLGNSLNGYWTWPTTNDNCFDCNLHQFPIGSYTLVAEDVWNQTAYAYFQVFSG